MIPRRGSVAALVITILVIAVSLMLGAFGALSYRDSSRREHADLRTRARTAADQLAAALALPLWNFDRAQIERVLESIMSDRAVAGVVVAQRDVSAPAGAVLVARERDRSWRATEASHDIPAAGLVAEERDITAGDETLGRVRVLLTPRFVDQALRVQLASIALGIVGVDLLLVVSLFALLWWTVVRPLQMVERYALAVSSERSPGSDIHGRRFHGEIESLRASIQKTLDLLDARFAEIQRINAELEQRVHDRTAELVSANRELEAFSYSVSHDLRAPLRAISGFSRILLSDFSASVPEEAARLLGIVEDNTRQMGHLIDDLLSFSRLSRQPLARRTVQVGPLVEAVVQQARDGEPPERRVEVVIEELPACDADPALLRQVFANLVSNAFKYTRRNPAARIQIGSRPGRRSGETVYFVRDNGTGFDMRYADKLFEVFQRLHRTEDFEGTGVGLAIVQRIVRRHGGRAWAESRPGEGATFHFRLTGGEHGDD